MIFRRKPEPDLDWATFTVIVTVPEGVEGVARQAWLGDVMDDVSSAAVQGRCTHTAKRRPRGSCALIGGSCEIEAVADRFTEVDDCTDDHSSGGHCPMHGYDDSVPPPAGFTWHRVQRSDRQVYSALVRST